MAVRSAVRHAPFFQRLHTVAIRPEVCYRKEVVARGVAAFFRFYGGAVRFRLHPLFDWAKTDCLAIKPAKNIKQTRLGSGTTIAIDDGGVLPNCSPPRSPNR